MWRVLQQAKPQDFSKYTSHFSELSFREKISRVGAMLGDTILLPLFRLYYIYRDPSVPIKAKLYITGALGYFIFPLDFLPDFLPGLFGFSDDLIVVGIVLKQVEMHLTPQSDAQAHALLRKVCPKKGVE